MPQPRVKRDPEDIFDEIGLAWLRFIARYAWPVGEHTFKLAAWLLICGAVTALGLEKENIIITTTGAMLSVLWFVTCMATIFKATGYAQDLARDKWLGDVEEHSKKFLIVHSLIMILTVFPLSQLFFAVLAVAGVILAEITAAT